MMEENPNSMEKPYQEIFQAGIYSFERGNYQSAIAQFQQALSVVNEKTQIGGEIQIWLANAYDAVGNSTEAIAICRRLKHHSDRDVRKSANYVLGILSAPKLSDLKDAVSTIPSLQNLNSSGSASGLTTSNSKSTNDLRPDRVEMPTQTNNSESQSDLNLFIWTTSAIVLAILIAWAVS
jgi:tetratricopeptide (TPR) repeat protein